MKPTKNDPNAIHVMDGGKECDICPYRLASIIGGPSKCPYLYHTDKCAYMKEWMRLVKTMY
jgi:hypothetical protein